MKNLILLICALLLLTSCATNDLPPEPNVPGAAGNYYRYIDDWASSPEINLDFVIGRTSETAFYYDVSVEDDFIYKNFYFWNEATSEWDMFAFDESSDSPWILDSASYEGVESLDGLNLRKDDLDEIFIVVYTCTKVDSGFDCHSNKWQLDIQNVGDYFAPTEPEVPTAPGVPNTPGSFDLEEEVNLLEPVVRINWAYSVSASSSEGQGFSAQNAVGEPDGSMWCKGEPTSRLRANFQESMPFEHIVVEFGDIGTKGLDLVEGFYEGKKVLSIDVTNRQWNEFNRMFVPIPEGQYIDSVLLHTKSDVTGCIEGVGLRYTDSHMYSLWAKSAESESRSNYDSQLVAGIPDEKFWCDGNRDSSEIILDFDPLVSAQNGVINFATNREMVGSGIELVEAFSGDTLVHSVDVSDRKISYKNGKVGMSFPITSADNFDCIAVIDKLVIHTSGEGTCIDAVALQGYLVSESISIPVCGRPISQDEFTNCPESYGSDFWCGSYESWVGQCQSSGKIYEPNPGCNTGVPGEYGYCMSCGNSLDDELGSYRTPITSIIWSSSAESDSFASNFFKTENAVGAPDGNQWCKGTADASIQVSFEPFGDNYDAIKTADFVVIQLGVEGVGVPESVKMFFTDGTSELVNVEDKGISEIYNRMFVPIPEGKMVSSVNVQTKPGVYTCIESIGLRSKSLDTFNVWAERAQSSASLKDYPAKNAVGQIDDTFWCPPQGTQTLDVSFPIEFTAGTPTTLMLQFEKSEGVNVRRIELFTNWDGRKVLTKEIGFTQLNDFNRLGIPLGNLPDFEYGEYVNRARIVLDQNSGKVPGNYGQCVDAVALRVVN